MREQIASKLFSHPILALYAPDGVQRRLLADQLAEIALECIYQPTRAMVDSGVDSYDYRKTHPVIATRMWKAMVASALGKNVADILQLSDSGDRAIYERKKAKREEKARAVSDTA